MFVLSTEFDFSDHVAWCAAAGLCSQSSADYLRIVQVLPCSSYRRAERYGPSGALSARCLCLEAAIFFARVSKLRGHRGDKSFILKMLMRPDVSP